MAKENSEKNIAKMLNTKLKNSVFLNCNVILAILNKFFIRINKVNIVDELFYKITNTVRYCDQLISFSKFATFMSIRQEKISNVIRKELGVFFQKNTSTICMGAMVGVTTVRMSPDLSIAKVYLSIFPIKEAKILIEGISSNAAIIKHELAQRTKHQLRRMPELLFFTDDSLEYIDQINRSLKGEDNPILNDELLKKRKKI